MAKLVTRRDQSVRLFQNPVCEALSHIHPATPLVVYLPVIGVCGYWTAAELAPVAALISVAAGLALWTFTEYVVHRVVFHYEPRTAWGRRLSFLLHGVHHDYPNDRTRLVMPLPVSVPLAVLFFLSFRALFNVYHMGVFTGFTVGYLAYDMLHYAAHHFPMRSRWARWIKRNHLRHHFAHTHGGYGVTSPLWDAVFGTLLPPTGRREGLPRAGTMETASETR
jgi:sterol desaturase/sphingolipid hydroxylase (fatty acid hydroxylase superfamily)